ncbi:mitochondrial ribosomal small subunit component [Blastocladiella emersonii ATCC 22665]|nr:mitochondrial ribosomal small subunit component [Blastocladiella emersonii ATCC 22665]
MPKAIPVFQNVSRQFQRGLIEKLPAWHNAMRMVPPTAPLPRAVCRTSTQGTQPFEASLNSAQRTHYEQQIRTLFSKRPVSKSNAAKHTRSAAKLRPQAIVYPEDRLRQRFFRDHPFELVRAQTLVEGDAVSADYATPLTQRASVSGEDVIQHQLYLVATQGLTIDQAYDQVTRELYTVRMREEAEANKLREERTKAMAADVKYLAAGTFQRDRDLAARFPINYPAWLQEDLTLVKNSEHAQIRAATAKASREQQA